MMYKDVHELVNEAVALIYPEDETRGHRDYLAKQEVHVSLLTKRTAEDCAKIILGETGRPDDERLARFWGFRGDGLGVAMSWDVAKRGHRELVVEKPIARGWKRTGSLDGMVTIRPNRKVILDWKTHAHPVRGVHDEAAWRQEMLYAATWWWQYQQGVRVWYPNEGEVRRYQQMIDLLEAKGMIVPGAVATREHLAFHAPDGLVFGGVASRIVGSFPQQTMLPVHEEPLSQLEAVENFYHEKELTVVESVEAGDPAIARSFDRAHPREHFREFKKMGEPPVPLGVGLRTLDATRTQLYAAESAYEQARVEMANLWVMPAGKGGGIEPGEYEIGTETEPVTAVVKPPRADWKLPCPDIKFRRPAGQGQGNDYEQ